MLLADGALMKKFARVVLALAARVERVASAVHPGGVGHDTAPLFDLLEWSCNPVVAS